MPTQLASIASDLRNIPLSEELKRRGLTPRKEGNSTMWRGNAWAINVAGDSLWFDHKAGRGGRGAIDLVMHMDNCGFKEAVETLSGGRVLTPLPSDAWEKGNQKHGELVIDLASHLTARPPLSEQMNQFAKRDNYRWPQAFSYLTNRRCLPPAVINDLHRSGRIYANNKGGIVFLHHDTNGNVGGATIKSTSGKFSQTIGNKTGAWFHVGQPLEAQTICITESPIDAISYSALHPDKHLCVISVSGQYIPDQLLETCKGEGKRVIIGLDNPALERSPIAGMRTEGVIETTLAKCPNAIRHTPTAKDWNDDLCAAKKRMVKSL